MHADFCMDLLWLPPVSRLQTHLSRPCVVSCAGVAQCHYPCAMHLWGCALFSPRPDALMLLAMQT